MTSSPDGRPGHVWVDGELLPADARHLSVFDRGFHGRTLLTMTMTSKLVYKRGFGPFAPEVYRSVGPYPYRGIGT